MAGSSDFGNLLWMHIRAAGMSQAQFAEKVGKKSGVIQFIRQGKRTPPPESITDWADILDLEGQDRERFILMAGIAHLPAELQPTFVRLIEGFFKLERRARDDRR